MESNTFKIATILDTFSYEVFKPEADLFQLTPQAWEQELKDISPDFFFAESAWRGKDDLWKDIIKHCPIELVDLVDYCKVQKIPTVFWNKEDPYHFDDFIKVASLFDHVFTTDIECIPRYKKQLQHEQVHLLPFACQPKIHNPIEKYDRKDAFVFAGAYYKRFSERNTFFKDAVQELSSVGKLDIYDRHFGNQETVFKYPEEYHPFIRGGLDYTEIDKAYKGYTYALNLNSMTDSPTMFSRRVFELMASNTMVISNYTIGVKTMLGDLSISTNDMKTLQKDIEHLKNDKLFHKKLRLAALRKVLSEHTAQVRMNEIISKVFSQKPTVALPTILCIAHVKDDLQLCNILSIFSHQSYKYKKLLLIISHNVNEELIDHKEIDIIKETDITYQLKENDVDYLAFLHPNDHYGANYLTDFMLATQYTDAKVITKGGCYTYSEQGDFTLENDQRAYTTTSMASVRSSVFQKSYLPNVNVVKLATNLSNHSFKEKGIFVIDEFNYCKNSFSKQIDHSTTSAVNDLSHIDCGVIIDDKWVQKQLEIIERLTEKKTAKGDGKKGVNHLSSNTNDLQSKLKSLTSVSFFLHPIIKIRKYKDLLKTYHKQTKLRK